MPLIFYDWFKFSGNLDRYETCWSVNDHLIIPTFWTQKYGGLSTRASTKSFNKKFITQKLNFKKD